MLHAFRRNSAERRPGPRVLGDARNLRFDRTFIVDANEDVIPDTRKEESLLPLKVRQILGMPTYEERDMLSAYYFHTLVKYRQVHIFFVENEKGKNKYVGATALGEAEEGWE